MKPIKSICIDTLTSIQDNDYMLSESKPGHDEWADYGKGVFALMSHLQDLGFENVLIIGDPGTGKSTGMRTLESETNIWFNADNKNPVWAGGRKEYGKKTKPKAPYHVVPKNYGEILDYLKEGLDSGLFVEDPVAFIIGHVETNKVGFETRSRLKTLGKLANKMQIEGKLETVLYSHVKMEGAVPKYLLHTQNNGLNTARSPQGMLEPIMENDYNAVLEAIRAYDEMD